MAELVRIGNSKGVRIPKGIIDQAHLEEKELEFRIVDEGLLICPVNKKPRVGWEEIFTKHSNLDLSPGETEWLNATLLNEEGWEW